MSQKSERAAVIAALLQQPNLPPVETLFRLVKEWGCRVNNLFHRADGQWQANLRTRDSTDFFKFACGPTAADAMIGALRQYVDLEYACRPPGDDERGADVIGSTRAAEADRKGTPAPATPAVDLFG